MIEGNKLRIYRKIKTDFKREQYLYADVDKKSLSHFIKIRVSNCNLNIEKGRYLKFPVEQRICQLCHMDVEDEFHFLMNCDKLIHERVTLFRNISDIVPSFTTMSDVEKFMFLLTSHDLDKSKVVILGVSNQGFQSGPVPGTLTRLRSCIVPAEITEPPKISGGQNHRYDGR